MVKLAIDELSHNQKIVFNILLNADKMLSKREIINLAKPLTCREVSTVLSVNLPSWTLLFESGDFHKNSKYGTFHNEKVLKLAELEAAW